MFKIKELNDVLEFAKKAHAGQNANTLAKII